MQLTLTLADAFARMPLTYLRQEYPNHIMHLLNGDGDALTPRELHPVFYGCFDWHSAVHGYWLLLRCIRRFPMLPCYDDITRLFDDHFTPENMARELAYFQAPMRASFERPYGYGWLLALAGELAQSSHPAAARWLGCLQPLTQEIRRRLLGYLDKLTYPIRVGTHFNTAFALGLSIDYARTVGDSELENAIVPAAHGYFGRDSAYPAHYEPAGDDFLSGALTEALLMSKVSGSAFPAWFDGFLPSLAAVSVLVNPAQVSDRADPKIAHLDGLNLSRAWCMRQIAQQLPPTHPARPVLLAAAERHLAASVDHVVGSHYSGGHWLATFALLALEDRDVTPM
ncbi:DUF2891 domain-containing protein [Dickeya chrysanthemi]|uniref:DUF2891 domain-containing protein n=1 Tax=Dickeya chrysanthemi TaxID=556 RepID=UPI0025A118B2|nr:DUF2891 domain-containing protein [Dickeya chrysanthemi]WJM86659.1 DUF2891 domain-containing protein [Dickeya chrysanthemi]